MITAAAFDRDGRVPLLEVEPDAAVRGAGRPFAHGLVGETLPDAFLRLDLESLHDTPRGRLAFADFRTARSKAPIGCPRSLCRRIVALSESRGLLPLARFERGFEPLLEALDRRRLAVAEGREGRPTVLHVALAAGEDRACYLLHHEERRALVARIEAVLEHGRPELAPFVGAGARIVPVVVEDRVAFRLDGLERAPDLHVAAETVLAALLHGLDAPALEPPSAGGTVPAPGDLARALLSEPFVEYYAARVEGRADSPPVPSPG